jgi:hypothetical protein
MSKPKITETDISKLTPDPNNARKRTPLSASVIRKSLEQFGAARSIVVDENDVIRAGNGTFEEAGQLGIEKVVTIEVDGNTIVAVKRRGLTEEQWKKYAIADNTASDFSTWDFDILSELTQEIDLSEFFPDDKLNELLKQLGDSKNEGINVFPDYINMDDQNVETTAENFSSNVKRSIIIDFPADEYDEAKKLCNTAKKKGEDIGAILVSALKDVLQ